MGIDVEAWDTDVIVDNVDEFGSGTLFIVNGYFWGKSFESRSASILRASVVDDDVDVDPSLLEIDFFDSAESIEPPLEEVGGPVPVRADNFGI